MGALRNLSKGTNEEKEDIWYQVFPRLCEFIRTSNTQSMRIGDAVYAVRDYGGEVVLLIDKDEMYIEDFVVCMSRRAAKDKKLEPLFTTYCYTHKSKYFESYESLLTALYVVDNLVQFGDYVAAYSRDSSQESAYLSIDGRDCKLVDYYFGVQARMFLSESILDVPDQSAGCLQSIAGLDGIVQYYKDSLRLASGNVASNNNYGTLSFDGYTADVIDARGNHVLKICRTTGELVGAIVWEYDNFKIISPDEFNELVRAMEKFHIAIENS